jgi:hypothetical protein
VSNETSIHPYIRPRRIPAIVSSIVVIMACCVAPLTLIALPVINQPSSYPNSTPLQDCPAYGSSVPYAIYNPHHAHLIIGFHKYACVSTPDQLNTVIGWYGRQGRRLPPESPSSYLVRTYEFNIANLMVFDDLSLQPSGSGTSIIWSADYVIMIETP